MAQIQGLDLVEIAPSAKPPVCKIMDFGKYQYEQKKKERESRKRQHQTQMKEVRFRPRTDKHDFDFKTKHASEFLFEGNKVRAFVIFRGREVIHQDQGRAILERFSLALQDVATVDQEPKMEGRRRMTMILSPLKAK